MPYLRRQGSEQEIVWDAPRVRNADRFTLPAAITAAGPVLHPRIIVMGLSGIWNNCKVSIACDVVWADVVFEVYARIQGSQEILIAASTPRSGNSRIENGTMYADFLNVCDFPCDGFSVYAVPAPFELPVRGSGIGRNCKITMVGWGTQRVQCVPELTPFTGVILGGVSAVIIPPNRAHHIKLITFNNDSANNLFVQAFDQSSLPLAGAVPDRTPITLSANEQGSFGVPDLGDPFRDALVVGVSTSLRTFTANATTDVLFTTYTRLP